MCQFKDAGCYHCAVDQLEMYLTCFKRRGDTALLEVLLKHRPEVPVQIRGRRFSATAKQSPGCYTRRQLYDCQQRCIFQIELHPKTLMKQKNLKLSWGQFGQR